MMSHEMSRSIVDSSHAELLCWGRGGGVTCVGHGARVGQRGNQVYYTNPASLAHQWEMGMRIENEPNVGLSLMRL